MDLTVRRAEPRDVDSLLALIDDVVAWLVARGRSGQWGAHPLSADPGFRARTAAGVEAGLVTVAVRDGVIVGAMAADRTVPGYVPSELVPPGALYVHTLVSARSDAGAGVGRLLLDQALELAAGTPIALDHWSGSPELAALYENADFSAAGTFTIDQRGEPWPGTLRVLDPKPR